MQRAVNTRTLGQLYAAPSRATSSRNVKILLPPDQTDIHATNAVYPEVLTDAVSGLDNCSMSSVSVNTKFRRRISHVANLSIATSPNVRCSIALPTEYEWKVHFPKDLLLETLVARKDRCQKGLLPTKSVSYIDSQDGLVQRVSPLMSPFARAKPKV